MQPPGPATCEYNVQINSAWKPTVVGAELL